MVRYSNKKLILGFLVVFVCAPAAFSQKSSARTRQRKEVLEAYRVCNQFQKLLAENLDFNRAFEATFIRNAKRLREIAITEGEFHGDGLATVDTATLVDAFKSQMQLLFLMFPLFSPDSTMEEEIFFPPKIKAIMDRKPPDTASEFAVYAVQLKRDVVDFRAHLEQLAQRFPNVAARIRDFKHSLTTPLPPPARTLKPLTAYSRGHGLGVEEEYYQIANFAVIREGREMRIIGINFFTRLF
jgi:hypothetical protein